MRPRHPLLRGMILVLLAGLPALAQETLVVLVKPPDSHATLQEIFIRLGGELRVHGFQVVLVDHPAAPSNRPDLAALSRTHHALAAIYLIEESGHASAELWVPDRLTRKNSMHAVVQGTDRDMPVLLAIRVVDLLRTSQLALTVENTETPPEEAAQDPAPKVSQVPDQTGLSPASAADLSPLTLAAGMAVIFNGGQGIGIGPTLTAKSPVTRRIALLLGLAGVFGQSAQKDAASASVREEWLTLLTELTLWKGGTVGLHSYLGPGVMHIAVRGNASPPWTGLQSATWVAVGAAGVGWNYQVSPRWRLDFTTGFLLLVPRPAINIAGSRQPMSDPILMSCLTLHVDL